MKKKQIFLSIVLALMTFASFGQINNNIVVFDITGSMVGKPAGSGNENIWDSSVELLEKQVKSFPANEKVTLYLFGEKILKIGEYSTGDPKSVSIIKGEVQEIKTNNAFENHTCIYRSLDEVISQIDQEERNTIYLFTDGKNSDYNTACGNIKSLNEIASKWQGTTAENEYLYVFKLKSFDLDQVDLANSRTQVIDDALTNLNVVIEPINTFIRVTKKNNSSSQQFRITGTGVEFIPDGLKIKVEGVTLTKSEVNESAYSTPSTFNVDTSVQKFEVSTHNNLDVVAEGIYKGKVNYFFEDNSKMKQFKQSSKTISVSIKDINTEILFKNLDVPNVTIEFID